MQAMDSPTLHETPAPPALLLGDERRVRNLEEWIEAGLSEQIRVEYKCSNYQRRARPLASQTNTEEDF